MAAAISKPPEAGAKYLQRFLPSVIGDARRTFVTTWLTPPGERIREIDSHLTLSLLSSLFPLSSLYLPFPSSSTYHAMPGSLLLLPLSPLSSLPSCSSFLPFLPYATMSACLCLYLYASCLHSLLFPSSSLWFLFFIFVFALFALFHFGDNIRCGLLLNQVSQVSGWEEEKKEGEAERKRGKPFLSEAGRRREERRRAEAGHSQWLGISLWGIMFQQFSIQWYISSVRDI